MRLTGVILLEQLAVEQRFLGERLRKVVLPAQSLEFLVRVLLLGVGLEIVDHGVADRVAEGRLLAHENVVRQPVALKGVAQQVLALAIDVALFGRVDGHDILHEVQIAERHAGLKAVDGDAAVGAQDIVHMQLADALGGFLLKCLRAGREVGVLVAEELIGDLAREQHAQVGLLVDGLADKVHADARADGRDVIGAEQRHDLRERLDHVLGRDDDLGVVGVQILRHLAGVLEVDGIGTHADSERADGLF